MMKREVVVTGLGLVSNQGEGLDAHLSAFDDRRAPKVETERFAPFAVHPVAMPEWERQIAKKSDVRQMETWQRLGVYAAGMALDHAGVKDDAELKSRMQLIVAAGGGERDYEVDGQILTGLRSAADKGSFLNERLMGDLRPTLFLAQLSNLSAGNIAIVHGVTGASRTFMGEEQAGIDALRTAQARIASGQTDIMLVGGSYNAERPDVLVIYRMGGFLLEGPYRPVAERGAPGGIVLGSGAAFLVLEAADHAAARGAPSLCRLHPVAAARTRRHPGDVATTLASMWDELGADRDATIVSGATGIGAPTAEECAALDTLSSGTTARMTGDLFGHMMEAQAPAGVALAAALIDRGDAKDIVVTSVGHHRGEGLVRLTRSG